jgi:poly(3-hydroxybutyrate) depolymerase
MPSALRLRHAVLATCAAFVLSLALTATHASAATLGCTLTPTSGTVTRTLGSRVYQLHVAQGLTGSQVPLLLSLHGAGSNGFEDE